MKRRRSLCTAAAAAEEAAMSRLYGGIHLVRCTPPGAGVLSASADTSVTPNISDSVMGRQPRTNVGYIDARQCGGYVLSK